MRRTTNTKRLRAILRGNTDVSYNATYGVADDDFYLYLTNGQKYLVKEGYSIDWSDDDEIVIKEKSMNVKKNMKKKVDESEGFWGGLGKFVEGVLEDAGDNMLADKVEIEWSEIRDIQSV